MKEKEAFVYVIENIVNKKKYVGITTYTLSQRFNSHIYAAKEGSLQALHSAIRKYGKENFIICKITKCRNWPTACEMEKEKIKELETFIGIGKGYNMTIGGEGGDYNNTKKGKKQTLESNQKRSLKLKGIPKSEETKIKFRLWKRTPEIGAKISASLIGRLATKEHKQNSSEALKQYWARVKLGEVVRAPEKWQSEESRIKRAQSLKLYQERLRKQKMSAA